MKLLNIVIVSTLAAVGCAIDMEAASDNKWLETREEPSKVFGPECGPKPDLKIPDPVPDGWAAAHFAELENCPDPNPPKANKLMTRDVPFYSVSLRWGGKMQHAGEIGQGDLRDKIKDALDKLCDQGMGHDVCGDGSDDNNKVTIDNIGYDDKGNRVEEKPHLDVRVRLAFWPGGYEGMKDIFHTLIADAYAISTQDDRNCRTRDFDGKKVNYCQIPEWVMVAINWNAWMFVQINFNGDTSEHYATCNFPNGLRKDYLGLDDVTNKLKDQLRHPAHIETQCWDENGNRAEKDGEP